MKYFFLLMAVFTLVSCGGTHVDYDYDKQANFSMYKTYNYLPDMNMGMSELDANRLLKATDSVLQGRGYTKSDSPSLLIDISSSQFEQASHNTIGIGVGGGGSNIGVGVGGGIPIGGRELHQNITFNVVDAVKDALIWQAVSESNLKVNASPESRQVYFYKLVDKVFKKYPPQN